MTEIDGSLLRGARYCVCCSLAAMKVNRGCHDIEAGNKMDERGGMKPWRWMKRWWKSETAFPLMLVDETDYGCYFDGSGRMALIRGDTTGGDEVLKSWRINRTYLTIGIYSLYLSSSFSPLRELYRASYPEFGSLTRNL